MVEEEGAGIRAVTSPTLFGSVRHDGRDVRWCGRGKLNPHGHYEPNGFSYQLRFSPQA